MATCSSADSVLEASSLIKANSEKLNKFVNGTDTQTVQLGTGAQTPVIRNIVRQIKADGEWIKQHIADAPEGDVSLNNVTALGSVSSRTLMERFSDIVNVKDYGAVGDGVTDDGAAIQAALDKKGLVYFPSGVYNSSRRLLISSDTAILGDNNAEVVFTQQHTENAGFLTDGEVLATNYSLASSVYRGDRDITLNSVSNLVAGDVVLIADNRPNQTTGDPAQGQEAVAVSRGYNGELHKIKSVNSSTNTITLYEGLWSEDFTVARNGFVKKLSVAKNISIEGLSIKSGASSQAYGININCADGFIAKNISVDGFYHGGIRTNLSMNGVIDGCRFANIIDDNRSLGYAVIQYGSQSIVTRGCVAELCGKLWDTGVGYWEGSNNTEYHYGNSRFLTCRDSSITSPLRCGISTHEPSDYITIENNIVSAQDTQEIYAILCRSNNVSILNNTIIYAGLNDSSAQTRGIVVITRGKAGRVDVSGNKVVSCKGHSVGVYITDVNSDNKTQATEYSPTLVSVSSNYIEPYTKSDAVAALAPIIIEGRQASGFASALISENLVYRATNGGENGGIYICGKLADVTISNNVVHGKRCIRVPATATVSSISTNIEILNIFSNYFDEQTTVCINIDTPSTVGKFVALGNVVKPPFSSAALFSDLPSYNFVSNIKIKSNGVSLEGALLDLFISKTGEESISGVKTFVQGPYYGTSRYLNDAEINLSKASFFAKAINNDVTFTITGVPSGKVAKFILLLYHGGQHTVTWPSSIIWPGNTPPSLATSSSEADIIEFLTPDGGTKWYGEIISGSFHYTD